MFTTLQEVHEAFMELFYKNVPSFTIKGAAVVPEIRYANKSANDYTEESTQQKYPCISIYNYSPEKSPEWTPTGHKYYGDFRDTDNDEIDDKATEFYEPFRLRFRYDVSIAAKGFNEFVAMENWMAQKFMYEQTAILDKVVVDGEEVGETVMFDIQTQRVPRTDGVLEENFEFQFDVWVQIKDPKDVDLITDLNLTINPKEKL